MNDLPTHIQRSHYVPDVGQRQRDKHLQPEDIEQFRRSERMVLRGPGAIGHQGCNVVAVFKHCPDDLMKAFIHRYNQHNYLMDKIERLQAHGRKRIRLTLAAALTRRPRP